MPDQTKEWEDYTVRATFLEYDRSTGQNEHIEETVGEINLPANATPQDMPIELEINGVVYKPEF